MRVLTAIPVYNEEEYLDLLTEDPPTPGDVLVVTTDRPTAHRNCFAASQSR